MTAFLLPNGKQQFNDGNGKPLAAGLVYHYIPNTSPPEFADTWQDINESVPNSNPITLDAAGRAIIWGEGVYRQVVYDITGALVWDQLTSSGGSGGGTGQKVFYYYSVYMEGMPADAELFPVLAQPDVLTLKSGLLGHSFNINASSLPTASFVITLQKNGSNIGTITISTSGVFTVSFPADVGFVLYDTFGVLWPTPRDATAGNISLTFAFQFN